MKRSLLLALLLTGAGVRAEGPDDLYLESFSLIEQAETFTKSGQSKQAIDALKQAESRLQKLQTSYPSWNAGMVKFRLGDVTERLGSLGGGAAPTTGPATKPAPEAVAAGQREEVRVLRSQVESLTAKLKEALAMQSSGLTAAERTRLEERVAGQQREIEVLKSALEQEKAKPTAAPAEEAALAEAKTLAKEKEALAARVKKLEEELVATSRAAATQRAALEKALAAAEARPAAAPVVATVAPAPAPSAVDTVKVAELQAKLAALEAKAVPFTTEEQALFKAPARSTVVLTETNATTVKRSVRKVPPGAGALVSEAERAAITRNYPLAETKFSEALQQEPDNTYLLVNLASAQFEQGKLASAEQHLERALKADPEDPASLSLMGIVRFRQERYDDALTCLSRSAQLDPNNSDTQNYLGITLSQKGQRAAAEAALRKAIQLAPDNPGAHNNLAIIYATQTPPYAELGWFHYRKARALGQPQDTQLEELLTKAAAAAK